MVDRSKRDPISADGQSLNACDLEALQRQRIEEAGYKDPHKGYRKPWKAMDEDGNFVEVPREVYYP